MAAFSPKIMRLAQVNRLTSIVTTPKKFQVALHNHCNVRSIHATCRPHFHKLQSKSLLNLYPYGKCQWYRVTAVRFQSTEPTGTSLVNESAIPYIPEPPPIPVSDPSLGLTEVVETLGEPTLASLGLGGWTPVGILQTGLEHLHVGLDLPWFATIAVGTLIARFLMFPLVVIAQKNAAKMNNYLPQMQILQLKMTEARQNGDALDAARYGHELMQFMKEKKMSPLKNIMVPLCQMPVFLSFFFALKGLANLPVESLKIGGIYWFTNLTLPDPFFILPVITSLTMLATIELGIESGMRADNLQIMRYVFRAMPFVFFPFIMNFPAAVLCYWVTTNFCSLAQAAFLRVPPVRKYFDIEPLIHHKSGSLPMKKKGVVDTVKENMANARIAKEIDERAMVDEMRFKKAGTGPIQKTFSYDPTKQTAGPPKTSPAAIEAKSADRR